MRRMPHACVRHRDESDVMSTQISPASAAADVTARPALPSGDGERFTGFGIMGLAFDTGHYLALRAWTETSIGAPYRSARHRDRAAGWHMYVTAPAEWSCPRYFSAAASYERVSAEKFEPDLDGCASPARAHPADSRLGHRSPGHTSDARDVRRRGGDTHGRADERPAARGDGPTSRPMMRAGRMRMNGAHQPAALPGDASNTRPVP